MPPSRILASPLLSFLSVVGLLTAKPMGPDDSKRVPDGVIHDHGVIISQYHALRMTMLALPGQFDLLYAPKDTLSVARTAKLHNFRYVVNGSYFHADQTHAGWLSIDHTVYAKALADRQLTHIVSCDRRSGTIEFISTADFVSRPGDGVTQFQTGPLIIDDGRLDSTRIRKSVNGRGSYPRTLLAVTNRTHAYLITVRAAVSLEVVGAFLLKASEFSGQRLDVINLDGGRSVALWSRDFPQLDFNQDARLPILLGVR